MSEKLLGIFKERRIKTLAAADRRTEVIAVGRPEDSWFLVEETDRTSYILYEWSRYSPYVDRYPREGTERFSPEEFLASDHDDTAKKQLARLMAKRRRREKPPRT